MTTQRPTIYTGDILLAQLSDTGELDICFKNGQPQMTEGLETCTLLAILGEDNWQNDIVTTESEKMKSEFPEVIRRGLVNDDTKNDGVQAINKALKFMKTEGIASEITVDGYILSAYAIGWYVQIDGQGLSTEFYLNWEKGFLTATTVS